MTALNDLLDCVCKRDRPHLAKRISIIIISLFLAGYLIACLMAPGHTIRQLNRTYGLHNELPRDGHAVAREYLEIASLARQKAYLESRLAMADSDSIGMVLNLRDSLVELEINGIRIHSATISGYKVDRFFFSLKDETYAGLFSQPLRVEHDRGTIVKEPVFAHKAPRDTIEAANFIFIPDTLHRVPVHITLNLTHGIRLSLYEDVKSSFRKKIRKITHYLGNMARQSGQNIFAMMHSRVPAYEPGISITLAGKNITSIYRALPDRARVTILI
ncbi:MAG: hypothetical protein AMS23_01060 [Bacteroides sp. SM1_62]|nr:MAG: hypothetical protein AMS26_04730 [Bacteroides sp. SM23_62]KPL26636.1 MAG: hypothetical protein AMS23_01060 [Bacteroides sp. SM1_62]